MKARAGSAEMLMEDGSTAVRKISADPPEREDFNSLEEFYRVLAVWLEDQIGLADHHEDCRISARHKMTANAKIKAAGLAHEIWSQYPTRRIGGVCDEIAKFLADEWQYQVKAETIKKWLIERDKKPGFSIPDQARLHGRPKKL